MRAAIMNGFGTPDTLRIADVPMPQCGLRDIVVEVAAAGVNPVDWKECEGHLQQFYGEYGTAWTPGYDGAGFVRQVGAEVTRFRPGDRVVAFSDRRENGHNGTFAEYLRVLDKAASLVPDDIELADAAAIPTAGLTGYQALFRSSKAALGPGDAVLIHGASGGVGSYAVQFAHARGIRVAASCSARNCDFVSSLGADLVLDHAKGGIVEAVREWMPGGVKAIIDCVSGGTLPDALDALSPSGRLISIATLVADGDIEADTSAASERGFEKILSIMEFDRIGEELAEVLDLISQGLVKRPPLETFSLVEAGKDADAAFARKTLFGLRPSPNAQRAALKVKLAALRTKVQAARKAYCGHDNDVGLSYFVIFKDSRTATIANQVVALPEASFEVSTAPVPSGVRWKSLKPLAIRTRIPLRIGAKAGFWAMLFFYRA